MVSPGPTTNTATITHADQYDPNTTNNTASIVVMPQQADLVLSKGVDDSAPNVGDTITYTVTARDDGPAAATGVTVQDLLPAGLTFVSATPSRGSYDSGTGTWTIGNLDLSTAQTLAIQARVTSPNPSTNTATITHADQFDPDTANNTASAVVTPQQADLALAKTVSDPTPNVGDTISYTITLTDNGPDAATGVSVRDLLPLGVVFVSRHLRSQGSYNRTTGRWTVGTVTTSAPQTLVLRGIVNTPNSVTNAATIIRADQFDPVATNNTASVVAVPQQADLAKTVSDPAPNVGDTITYTITLTDNGPDAATDAQVTDMLPAGLTFVSDTPSQGTYNSGTGLWTVGTVATTSPQTLTIQALVVSPSPQTNTATISHSDQFDPVTANNIAAVLETPRLADLVLSKTVDDPTPNVGDVITFTITLGNNGPNAATNVEVTDVLPSGLSFVSDTPSKGTYDLTTGIWTVGTVTTAVPQTLTLQATVLGPVAQTNTATITHADQYDPDTGNNIATATETPQQADLVLSKSVDNRNPNVGDTISYTINLSDNGPDSATTVVVSDPLPSGLFFLNATASQGIYNPLNGLWTVGTVATTGAQSLQIRAMVIAAGSTVNTATISHADQFDPVIANNTATTSVNPLQADLSVTKTVNDATPNVGETISYTVTLTDNGLDARHERHAPGPRAGSGLVFFVAAAPGQGTYDPTTGIWTVGGVADGSSAVLTIQAKVESPAPTTNTATITHADQFDPNPGNNTASTIVTPQLADLFVTKTVNNAAPNVGNTITFTVAVGDNGPDRCRDQCRGTATSCRRACRSSPPHPAPGATIVPRGPGRSGRSVRRRPRRWRSGRRSRARIRRPMAQRSPNPTSSTPTPATTPRRRPLPRSRPTWRWPRPSVIQPPTWATRSPTPSP